MGRTDRNQSCFWHRVVLAVSLFNSFSTANAVEITARIEGTVTDPSGAVIPNAQVTATNTDTGVVTTKTTSSIGDYILQKLCLPFFTRPHCHRTCMFMV